MTSKSAQLASALALWPFDWEQRSLLKKLTAGIDEDRVDSLLDLLRAAESAVTSCANFLDTQSKQRARSSQQPMRVEGLRPARMKFRPLHDRVVIRRIPAEERTAGGIVIPDTAKEKPMEGEVVAVGPGGRDEAGKLVTLHIKAGDKVLFGKWSGTEVEIDGADLVIMKESEILGVIEGVIERPVELRGKTKGSG
jgi:chaperonin GroES